jgi:two-component system, sensor histidine kinase and response regulator
MKNPQPGEDDQMTTVPASLQKRSSPFGGSIGHFSGTGRILYGVAAVALSFLTGWLSLQAERFGWYGPGVGLAIFAVANGTILFILLWIGVLSVRGPDRKENLARDDLSPVQTNLESRVLERTSELAEANAVLRRQMESHAQAERDLQEIMGNSIDVICTFDAEGRFLQVSRASERLWGYSPEELIGQPYIAMVHPEDREKTEKMDQSILSGLSATGFENRYLRKDGSVVWTAWTANWSEELKINVCVARDVTARKEMEHELLRVGKAAGAASLAKGEFLTTISHEIRTPMNGIIGMTDMVLTTPLDPDQREWLGIAKSSARALLDLLNDILDLSKIEAGKLELEATSFSLRACIGEVLKTLAGSAGEKGLELNADIPAKLPDHLIGDPMRLRQILMNLVDNAIKFTEHGDVILSVAVKSVTDDCHCLHFSVSDTGIGVPVGKQAQIFEPFRQADGSTTRTHGGAGLGLAIAEQLVEKMGGRIWLESRPTGGTIFHFTVQLPVGQTPLANARTLDPLQLKGLRVLVVDDNAVNRRILRATLENWGMELTVAASGAEALEEMHRAVRLRKPISLVLLDVMMPEMDGFMVAEKIRDQVELSGATVMMLSSAMSTDGAKRCDELDIATYLLKPVSEPELLDAILLAIGGQVERQSARNARSSAANEDRLHILLVEDNAVHRIVATAILRQNGHTLAHAADGVEAVEIVGRESFDLVLMDVQMPEMDGFEATRRIRQAEHEIGRHTPIVALTAHAMDGDRERCLAAGMDDYLSKPLKKAEVIVLLKGISARRHGEGELGNVGTWGRGDVGET